MKTVYSCGPTTYSRAHIGNLRSFVFADNEVKKLEAEGHVVNWVMNITDIDDKILDACGIGADTVLEWDKHLPIIREFTEPFNQQFKKDLQSIGIDTSRITFVRATDHIETMRQISELDAIIQADMSGELEFAIWKDDKNRPGWHLECTAMILACFGDTVDLHTGGIDLKFPHHENENIIFEAFTGKPIAREFKYCNYLIVDGDKMSKSLGNQYTLEDLKQRGYNGRQLRALFDNSNDKRVLDFTFDKLDKYGELV